MGFGLDAFLSKDLFEQLELAIGGRLASAKLADLRAKWDELLGLYKREGHAASGGSSGISSRVPAPGPPDSSGDEEMVDELVDDGEGALVQKTRSSRRQLAGKQKEERPKRRQSKVNLKVFDDELHELREPKVRCSFVLAAMG